MRIRKLGNSLFVSLLLIVAFHFVSGSLPQPEGKKRRIELLWADSMTHDVRIIANADRFIGHVKFSQNNVILNCDSAYFFNDSNKVDAFGHVHIIQGDTLNLYGDRIKYEGNTKIAKINGNVKLVNKSITLTTDELIFDLRTNIGDYRTWGKIVDTANVLVSKIGRYYSNEDLCFFKDSVKVTNKDFVLTADTLKYNSKTERVFIVGPTHIVGTTKQGTLYSEKGWYDTRTNIAELYKSSKLIGKEQSLQGDTIFYSRNTGIGRAKSRVILSDTTNHIAITGRKGDYNEKTKIAFVTDSAIFMQFSKNDTLFLHADTLKSIPDLPKKAVTKKEEVQMLEPKKSNSAKADTSKANDGKKADLGSLHPQKRDSLAAKSDTLKIPLTAQSQKSALKSDSLKTIAQPTKIPSKSSQRSKKKLLSKKSSSSEAGPRMTTSPESMIRKEVVLMDTYKKNAGIVKTFHKSPSGLKVKPLLKDSLFAAKDTGKNALRKPLELKTGVKDSLKIVSDTLQNKDDKEKKVFLAYHRVRFFKKDLQGNCDSLAYQMKDSVMRLYNDPILWSDIHQMTADRIEFRPHTPDPDIARLDNNGFIISKEDSIKFNQISGKVLIGYIFNNALKNIEVNGNAVTLYYLKNKDRYSGMNKLESSKINVYLLKGKIDSISFFPKPEGKTIPMKELTPEESKLNGFEWRESEQPKSRLDLYPLDEKRKKIAGPEKKPASKKLANPNF